MFQGLYALIKARNGGLGDLLSLYAEMDQSSYFSCVELLEYVRCGFGFKTLPSAFANYVGGSMKNVKKCVRNWLDEILFQSAHLKSSSNHLVKPLTVYGKAVCR